MMFNLSEKIAVVTGGGGVLGGAIARGLAEAGAKVAILGRTQEKVENRVGELQSQGSAAMGLIADVLDRRQLERAKDALYSQWGKADILVNAAGGNLPGAVIMPDKDLFSLSTDAFDQVMSLNVKGSLLPILVFGEAMARSGAGGCFLNISSMAAQQPLTRVMGYSASKAAIDNLTKWLAVEMARKFGPSFRVNAIAPGFFVGDQNRDLLLNEDGSYTARGNTIIEHTPMGRFGKPEELIGAAQWLCSDAASFVTGVVIPVDGGFSAFSGV